MKWSQKILINKIQKIKNELNMKIVLGYLPSRKGLKNS